MRRTVTRWKRFLRELRNGHSSQPYRDFTAKELHLFASRLASRRISWQELDEGWKAVLRRRRKQREAEALRVELEGDEP